MAQVADTDSLVTALLVSSAVAFVVIAAVGYALYFTGGNAGAGDADGSPTRTTSISNSGSRWLSRLRPCRMLGVHAGDVRRVLGLVFMMLLFVPLLLNMAITFGAVLLVAAEGWPFYKAFVFIWQDTFSIGPFVNDSPVSAVGRGLLLLDGLLVFVLVQVVLGIVGGLEINDSLVGLMPQTAFGLLRVTFLYSPLCMFSIVLVLATALATIEGWDLFDSVAYVIDILCNIEDAVTDVSPITAMALYVSTLFLGVTLCAAGSLISVVGRHPVIVSFVNKVDGHGKDDPEEEYSDGAPTPQCEHADAGSAQEPDEGTAKESEVSGGIETCLAETEQHRHPSADIEHRLHRNADAVSRTPTGCEERPRDARGAHDWLGSLAPNTELDHGFLEHWPRTETSQAVQAETRATMSTADSELGNFKVDEEAQAQVEKLSALLAGKEAERAIELLKFRTLVASRDEKVAAQDEELAAQGAELRRLQAALSSCRTELELSRRALEASHQRELKLHSASQAHNVDLAPGGMGNIPSPWSTCSTQLRPVVNVRHEALTSSRSAPVVSIAAVAVAPSGRS